MADHAAEMGVSVVFAPEASFDVEAVKRAAYRLSDRISIEITDAKPGLNCRLRLLTPSTGVNLESLAEEFRNEVLDQDLRQKIAAETEGYRNLILSLAFSKTPLGK
jgi:His-Xaa-Ser system protein HxsD